MTNKQRFDPELSVIEIEYTGSVDARELRESTSEAIAFAKQKKVVLFLVDASNMEFDVSVSMADLFELPSSQYFRDEVDRGSKIAVVSPDSHQTQEALRFYESACRNRGWKTQVFFSRQEAVGWLTNPSQKAM